MEKTEIIKYWRINSERDFDAAESLYNDKKYTHALFFGHLVIEKLLKALFIKVNDDTNIPRIHNLLRLAEHCRLELEDEVTEKLSMINSFNLNTRYDDYLERFYLKCNEEYCKEWLNNIKELKEWLISKL
jgi:HEPN domain-containing protein